MRNNTPPQSPYRSLEEEIIEAEDGEAIYIDDEEPQEDMLDEEPLEGYEMDDDEGFRIPERDDSIQTFKKHFGAVFCCDLHPSQNLAVTGGEDDKAFVWNIDTTEVVYEVENHKDTVIATAFSHDGAYLATADLAGEIQVFKVQGFKKVWEFSMGDMGWMKWHMASNVLMAGSDTGEIYVWKIPSGDCKILPGNGKRSETAELTNDGRKLYAGYGDGCLKLWDIKTASTVLEVNENNAGHEDNVLSVSCDPDKSLYMSGSEDGKILLVSDSGVVGSLDPSAGPVEVVAFCPDTTLKVAASGTLSGQVAIWDIQKQSIRSICEHNESDDGITTLKWLPEQTLVVGTIRGNISAFDGRSGTKKYDLMGHAAEVYNMCYDKVRNILLTASEDSTAKIFKIVV